ncbi:MAG: hypothetical protein Q4G33_11205 [bacterium]|nr:hypothetical protein [bacterium]
MENTSQSGNKGQERRIRILRGAAASAVCIAAAAGFFYGGYRMGAGTMASPVSAPEKHAELEGAETVEDTCYIVISENGRLCLYESNSIGQRLIASEEISIGMFPKDDREALLKGEKFSDFGEAQALFEDFAG